MTLNLVTLNTAEDYLELVQTSYTAEIRFGGIPNLIRLYETFCGEWFLMTHHFLETNASAFEITSDDLLNLEDKLDELGFKYPSFEDFRILMNAFNFVYESESMIFNEAVRAIW